jgi:flagellar biosynthesis anti-sigma factor FlgM
VSMHVKGTNANAVDAGGSRAVDPVRGGTPAAPANTPGAGHADNLGISGSAHSLANLQEAIAATPEINVEHVAGVSKSIESGQYTVNAARIADRMLQLECDLAAATHQSLG